MRLSRLLNPYVGAAQMKIKAKNIWELWDFQVDSLNALFKVLKYNKSKNYKGLSIW